jgi:hypothetical protein
VAEKRKDKFQRMAAEAAEAEAAEEEEEEDEEEAEDEGNEEHLDLFCRNERFDVNDLSTKRALAFSVADAVKMGTFPHSSSPLRPLSRISLSHTLYLLSLLSHLVGSLVRDNLELYHWACGMIAFDKELQSCCLFHRLSKTPPDSIRFKDVSPHSPPPPLSLSKLPMQWLVSGKAGRETNLIDLYSQLEHDRKESSERGDLGNMYSGQ